MGRLQVTGSLVVLILSTLVSSAPPAPQGVDDKAAAVVGDSGDLQPTTATAVTLDDSGEDSSEDKSSEDESHEGKSNKDGIESSESQEDSEEEGKQKEKHSQESSSEEETAAVASAAETSSSVQQTSTTTTIAVENESESTEPAATIADITIPTSSSPSN